MKSKFTNPVFNAMGPRAAHGIGMLFFPSPINLRAYGLDIPICGHCGRVVVMPIGNIDVIDQHPAGDVLLNMTYSSKEIH